MDGRNEIVSVSGVSGNRHATSVPPAFSRRSDRVALPLSRRSGRPPRRRHEMRSLAHEFAAQRGTTPARHETWSAGPWDVPRQAPVAPVAPLAPAAVGPTRRAILRRALRQGLLRPASRLRDQR